LSLLYDDAFWKFEPHIDHIFPKKLFSKKEMTERGVPQRDQERLAEASDRLGNLQILTATENKEKSDASFSSWIITRGAGFLERQLIPPDRSLWDISEFEGFLENREKLIRVRLQSLFNESHT
jgi:hypothetical protein